MITPFERNLELWRQLWRVIERSHAVVQVCTLSLIILWYYEPFALFLTLNRVYPYITLKNETQIFLYKFTKKFTKSDTHHYDILLIFSSENGCKFLFVLYLLV